MEQDELARQFAATQQQRYGHRWKTITRLMTMRPTPRAELARCRLLPPAAAVRYRAAKPPGANPFSPADYEFSPMKTLVNDGPSEPLFTPTPEVQPQQPAQLSTGGRPQQGYQPAQHQPIHHRPVPPQPQSYPTASQPVQPQQPGRLPAGASACRLRRRRA